MVHLSFDIVYKGEMFLYDYTNEISFHDNFDY